MPPQLSEAFRQLKRGRHICRDDAQVFRDLVAHEQAYTAIFEALGYRLERHPQDFFYLRGESSLKTKALQAASLFVLILFQDLEEKKFQSESHQWHATLTTRLFRVADMPHFLTTQRRRMMTTIGVAENELKDVLRTLKQLGMLEWIDSEHFQFRAPIYRFIDICIQLAQADEDTKPDLSSAKSDN